MKRLFLVLAFLARFGVISDAQVGPATTFVMAGQPTSSTFISDSTYQSTWTFFSDQLGGGYFPTQIDSGFIAFDGNRNFYLVDSVLSADIGSAVMRLIATDSTSGAPFGVGVVYEPIDTADWRFLIPPAPVNSDGISSDILASIIINNLINQHNNAKITSGTDLVDTVTVSSAMSPLQPLHFNGTTWEKASNALTQLKFAWAIVVDSISSTSVGIQSIGTASIPSHGLSVGQFYSLDSLTYQLSSNIDSLIDYDQWLFNIIDANTIDIKLSSLVKQPKNASGAIDDRTRLSQDSILIYTQNGTEVGRDTIAGVGGGGGGSGHVIADEGTGLTARDTLDFVGAGVTVTDGGTKTTVTIPTSGADGNGIYDGDGTTPADTDISVTDNIDFGNGTLFLDDTNNRIGLNTNSPQRPFDMISQGNTSGTISFRIRNSSLSDMMTINDAGTVFLAATNVGNINYTSNILRTTSGDPWIGILNGGGKTRLGTFGASDGGIEFVTRNSVRIAVDASTGRAGIGLTSPTAFIHIKAGTTTANTGSLKIDEGSNPTTPEDGLVNHVSDNLTFTAGSTVYTLAKTLTATGALDFASTSAQNSADLTITVTGAADGDAVSLGVPNASVNANTSYSAWVSGSNTVTVRFNNYSSGAVDPASGTFRVSVLKY